MAGLSPEILAPAKAAVLPMQQHDGDSYSVVAMEQRPDVGRHTAIAPLAVPQQVSAQAVAVSK